MAIEFACPVCGGTLRVEGDSIGQVVRCGGCMTMLRVPDADHPTPDVSTEFPAASTSPFSEAEPPPSTSPPPAAPPEEPVPDATPDLPPRPPAPDESERPPRRRRARREPPPMGRSPLVWVVLTLGLLGVGSCVFCCGIAALLPQQQWKMLNSSKGGFKVEVPASPKHNMTPKTFKPDKTFTVEGTRVFGSNEEFVVLYKDITRGPNDTDEKLLDQAVREVKGLRAFGKERSFEMDGFPAREFEFHDSENNTCIARAILADTRLYILIVGTRSGMASSGNAMRFFNSFAITDEKLLAAAGKRQDAHQNQANDAGGHADRGPGVPVPPPVTPKSGDADRLRTHRLGVALGNVAFPIIVRDVETRRQADVDSRETATLAAAVGAAAFVPVASEQERARIAGVGAAATTPAFDAVARERARAVDEARIHALGAAIGQAVAAAIEEALGKE